MILLFRVEKKERARLKSIKFQAKPEKVCINLKTSCLLLFCLYLAFVYLPIPDIYIPLTGNHLAVLGIYVPVPFYLFT